MTHNTANTRYTKPMRLIHGVMAACIIAAVLLGFYPSIMPKGFGGSWWLHKSLGMTVLLLLPIRIWLRQHSKLPPLPGSSAIEHATAKAVHHLLYVAMLLVAGSGYLMAAAKGKAVMWFGVSIPPVAPQSPELAKLAHEWHEPFVYFLLALLALHLAALIKHRLIDHTNLFPRMF